MLKRHPLISFFILAFILSWYPWIIALFQHRQTGPNPLGPMIAAVIITAFTVGRKGVKTLLARIVRWRVSPVWYAAVILIPVLCSILAATISVWLGAPMPKMPSKEVWTGLIDRFIFIFLFIGLGEETGWRGYALEQLQKQRSPLRASLILAPIWAIWHLPLLGLEIHASNAIPFVIGVFAATILETWVYNNTNGSVLLIMLFHTTVNTIGAGFIFQMFSGNSFELLWWVYSAIWLAAALLVIKAFWKEFSKNPLQLSRSNLDLTLAASAEA